MRLLSLIAVMLAACAVAVYAGINFAADKPKEPVNLLVGKWRMITLSGKPLPREITHTIEYFEDNSLHSLGVDQLGAQEELGLYTFDSTTLTNIFPNRTERTHIKLQIVSLDSEKLVVQSDRDEVGQYCVFLK